MNELFDRFTVIAESSDDAIITKTPDGTITSWNRAAARIFGYDPDEAIGRHITMLFPRERLAEEGELLARIARGERVNHFETQRIRKDGTKIEVSITLSPVRDQHGRIVEISKIARDITARKRFEAEAHEHVALFRSMADAAPVMIWMSGTDTRCTFFNEPWLQFTGRTMQQELGKGLVDGVHPDDLQRCLDIYLGAFHGQHRWIVDTGVPRYTGLGEFAGYIGSCIDITDMKTAATALASEAQTTRAFFESAAEGIVIVNQSGQIMPASAIPAWRRTPVSKESR